METLQKLAIHLDELFLSSLQKTVGENALVAISMGPKISEISVSIDSTDFIFFFFTLWLGTLFGWRGEVTYGIYGTRM